MNGQQCHHCKTTKSFWVVEITESKKISGKWKATKERISCIDCIRKLWPPGTTYLGQI